jgi:peptidoglycan LD-endopeptidase LytH
VVGAGGYRYFYTHFDEFAEDLRIGQEVSLNTLLGYVGNTGNAEGTPPHLHLISPLLIFDDVG